MSLSRRLALPGAICLVLAAVVAWGFATVPADARIPTHWNLSGEVDGWSSKTIGLLFPLIVAVVATTFLAFVPNVDPRRAHLERSAKAIVMVSAAIDLFMLAVCLVGIASARGWNLDLVRPVGIAVGLLFMTIGNYLTKLQSNFFVGIRTPWTIDSEVVWRRTHRLGGRLFAGVGIIALLVAAVSPSTGLRLAITGAVAAAVVTAAYSFLIREKQAST